MELFRISNQLDMEAGYMDGLKGLIVTACFGSLYAVGSRLYDSKAVVFEATEVALPLVRSIWDAGMSGR